MQSITVVVALPLPNGEAQILPYEFADPELAGYFIDDVFNDFPEAIITCEQDGKPVTGVRHEDGSLTFEPLAA